jgi:hypothetical protein
MWLRAVWYEVTDVSEDPTASIFTVHFYHDGGSAIKIFYPEDEDITSSETLVILYQFTCRHFP